ncbi:vanadium-dependent haloperoxidase [Dyadobacter sandarakinus]|uniref:Vanadium-dependent haloperoxidase n=1 Tax=Dyadobacter sandarakinus TaxID=2747268 RepID=A0ABX7I8T0_9BACT|nr:vanadium-dependent haloperoxidase [Dyadobacter sandarakinus]QRR02509.1 vanadium-dependent haloperoxidase [Dyadobacter sandarakinus]
MRLRKVLLQCFAGVCIGISALISPAYSQQVPTALLHRAEKNLTRTIVHDIFSPPVASRIYLYANTAAYEALIHGDRAYNSVYGQVKGFPNIPAIPAEGKVNHELAATYAFFQTGSRLVFSEHLLLDSVRVILAAFGEKDSTVYKNSLKFGQAVSDSIMVWSATDNYAATRRKRRYTYSREKGKWTPTPPGYIDAVEPYWSQIRPCALDSAAQFKPVTPPAFSTDTSSAFMKDVREVYTKTQKLSQEEVLIASFWDCNPFYLNTQGHLNFATKKLSPGGHWISIAGQATESARKSWKETAVAYLCTSIALFDGFISCWDEKYRSQMIRPETVINAYMDEKWRPMLQTPPFPEYTSGHSVISAAAATVLTACLGDAFALNDDTETPYGLPVRHFRSFRHASDEAAISRLYGGIHYRSAIVNGQRQGELIGQHVLQKILLKR